MSLQLIENNTGNILELEVTGKFVAGDFQSLESTFQRAVKQHGKIRVLFRMRDFHGWEPAAFWDEIKFDLKHLGDIDRLAMIGDKEWEKFLGVFGRPFTAAEIRYFDKSALPAARAWLGCSSIGVPGEKPTQQLHDLGQSLWLDNITRGHLANGTLRRYIDELSITGLTSNPSIFDHAIRESNLYDDDIHQKVKHGQQGEDLFFDLAIADLRQAADLFRPIYDRTNGIDGWVSLEVSPALAYDTPATIAEVARLRARAERPNLFVKIPGTPEGIPAIEQSIFAGVPVNVTLLFSREQYLVAAAAYLRGIERRVQAGLNPDVGSLASVFISRWDKATMEKVPEELRDKLGIAIAKRTYKVYRELLESDRWLRLANLGARPQRLLWASTGTKDPAASDVLYIKALAAPFTVNTIPDKTLLAFADHGSVGELMPTNGGDAEEMIAQFARAGINCDKLAADLQREAAESFVKDWNELLNSIATKSA